jgi:hypothetical protein
MLILFDNGTPAPLRHALHGHVVVEAFERGSERLVNGELIAAAETAGFELLLTTDKNMRCRQNLTGRRIAFIVIGNRQWPVPRRYLDRVVAAVNVATPGSFTEVEIPRIGSPTDPLLSGKSSQPGRANLSPPIPMAISFASSVISGATVNSNQIPSTASILHC